MSVFLYDTAEEKRKLYRWSPGRKILWKYKVWWNCLKIDCDVQSLSCVQFFATPWTAACPGLPVLHHLQELAQTHVHWVGDAIQPSHPLSSPSPTTFNLPSIRVFSNESALCIRWAKYWSFSFSISPYNEYTGPLTLGLTGWSPCNPRES